jgi:hypothetical protein
MSIKKAARWLLLLAAFSLFATACGDSDSDTGGGDTEASTDEGSDDSVEPAGDDMAEDDMGEEHTALPGTGVSVTMARAD